MTLRFWIAAIRSSKKGSWPVIVPLELRAVVKRYVISPSYPGPNAGNKKEKGNCRCWSFLEEKNIEYGKIRALCPGLPLPVTLLTPCPPITSTLESPEISSSSELYRISTLPPGGRKQILADWKAHTTANIAVLSKQWRFQWFLKACDDSFIRDVSLSSWMCELEGYIIMEGYGWRRF